MYIKSMSCVGSFGDFSFGNILLGLKLIDWMLIESFADEESWEFYFEKFKRKSFF